MEGYNKGMDMLSVLTTVVARCTPCIASAAAAAAASTTTTTKP